MTFMAQIRTLNSRQRNISRVLTVTLGISFLGLATYDIVTGDILLAVGHLLVAVLAALAFYLASATPDRPHATQKRVTTLALLIVFPLTMTVHLAWILV